jgi:hypothetical protein
MTEMKEEPKAQADVLDQTRLRALILFLYTAII